MDVKKVKAAAAEFFNGRVGQHKNMCLVNLHYSRLERYGPAVYAKMKAKLDATVPMCDCGLAALKAAIAEGES